MKSFKKILAVLIAAALVLSLLCGCEIHKKNETVITSGDVTIGSELYLMYLMQADYTFRQQVDSTRSEAKETAISNRKDYYKQTLDSKKADVWIKDKCLEYCKTYIWTSNTFKQYGLELTAEEVSELDQYISFYWDYYGYSKYYEENGVSKEAFRLYYEELFKQESIFNYFYGKEGTEAVSDDEAFANIKDTYIFAEVLKMSNTDSDGNKLDDEALTALTEQAAQYAAAINAGTETIASVSEEYNGKDEENTASPSDSTSSDSTSSDNASSEDTSSDSSSDNSSSGDTSSDSSSSNEEEIKSKYPDAKVYSAEDSDASIHTVLAEEVKKEGFATDTAYSVSADSGVYVYVVRSMDNDKEYIIDQHATSARHNLKDDAFKEIKDKGIAGITPDVSKSLVKRFKPETIIDQNEISA